MEETICFICRRVTDELIALKSLDGKQINVCLDCQKNYMGKSKEKK